jgi:colanic acid/amylovoran biosynthesis glycosyltransferase
VNIVHVWTDYTPSLFDQTHPWCLRQPGTRSRLLAARLIDNGMPVPAETHAIVRETPEVAFGRGFGARVARKLREPFLWRRLNGLIREAAGNGADLVHFHFGTTAAKALPALERLRQPSLVSFYGVDASASLRDSSTVAAYQRVFARVGRVIVLCDAVRERLAGIGCPREKIAVVNLPAGVEKYPYRAREPREGTPPRFLIAARFVEKKGHPLLLDAFERIIRSGKDARLTMLGYGPLKSALEERVRATPELTSRVRIVDTALTGDFETTYRRELESHDLFVLPSTTARDGDDEGGPALTLVCAQAAGLPVISTPFPGAELSVLDQVTGLICREENAAALASKMTWLMERPAEWNRLGREGAEHTRRWFSLDGQMKEHWRIYQQLLGNSE